MILVVGGRADPHVQSVLRCLASTGSSTLLLDAYDLESGGVGLRTSPSIDLVLGRRDRIELAEFTSIWWRQKPKVVVPAHSVVEQYNYGFVQREWNTIYEYVALKTAGIFAINDRMKARLAENKAFQLESAGGFAFEIPRTIITNDVGRAAEFFGRACVNRCVYKSFSPYMPPNATMTYTTELDAAEMSRADVRETEDATPGIFQELIEAAHELRVTVVGQKVFTARIDAHGGQAGIDWRVSLFKNKYSPYSLPEDIERHLLQYHARLGLVFAAYDFIVAKNGTFYFLEVNPSGQWMWLEQQLDMPISAAIAESLRRSAE